MQQRRHGVADLAALRVGTRDGADDQVHELVITNPRYPVWGRIVVGRGGLMEWDYWGNLGDDHAAADLATVITIIGTRPGDDAERYGQAGYLPAPGERDRPHP